MTGAVFFTALLFLHGRQFEFYLSPTLWLVEFLLLASFVLAYITRHQPKQMASSFTDICLPPVCAILPFLLIYDWPQLHPNWPFISLKLSPLNALEHYALIAPIMIAGTVLTLVSLLTLRRSFSILTEARALVTSGPYRYISHPMYLGEWIIAFGSACLRSSPEKWVIFGSFLVLQWLRLKNEEKKLSGVFPEYQRHRLNCWIRF